MNPARFAYYAMLVFIFALVIAIGASRASPPELPTRDESGLLRESQKLDDNEKVVRLCRAAQDAYNDGDKGWLERYFDGTPATPWGERLLITRFCTFYLMGRVDGAK